MEQENKLKSNHIVEITDRNETKITCVNKLNSFNDKEFYLETDFGNMQITGSNMTLGKMDVENKVLVINYVLFFCIFINIILAAKVGCTYYRYISNVLQSYCNILIYN